MLLQKFKGKKKKRALRKGEKRGSMIILELYVLFAIES